MSETVKTLSSILAKTTRLVGRIDPAQHHDPTPCSAYDVDDLLDHMAIWIQVFDAAVNDTDCGFDPHDHQVDGDRAEIIGRAGDSIVEGLAARGWDRPMTMTADPIPGEFVLNMALMEYLGHGWDLAVATGQPVPFDDDEAAAALEAARAILSPEYRGHGMFDQEVEVTDGASAIDRCVAFIGRDPAWTRTLVRE